jgi:hypothetical protein
MEWVKWMKKYERIWGKKIKEYERNNKECERKMKEYEES